MDHLINLIAQYKYLILFPAAIVEGPVLAMICGFLSRIGTLSFFYSYIILMAADLVGDAMWYGVGYHWGDGFLQRFGKYLGITPKMLEISNKFYQRYHNWILVISKLTMGLGVPFVVLISAGVAKINFKKYMMLNFLGQIIWTGGLMAIGYFLGNFYLVIYKKFETVSAVSLFVLLFILVFGVGKYIRHKIIKKYS
jgi:membrane-associated protein